jgi:4-hydroxybenzoate polyprenyltransferase
MTTSRALLLALRPKQWTKNLLLFAGLIFSGSLLEAGRILDAVLGFAIFCGLSGAVYLFNDLLDIEGDRRHPLKQKRPIASGQLSTGAAWIALGVISVLSLLGAWFLGGRFFVAAAGYLALMLAYSAYIKHVAIADLFVVASGFVLRAVAGVLAIEKPGETLAITPWFLGCLFFGALLIVLGKRRHELSSLAQGAGHHRRVLNDYSLPLIDQLICISASACVVSYSLYAVIGPTASKPNGYLMFPSIIPVLFGLFRYLFLVYQRNEGGAPENLLLRDKPILLTVLIWLMIVIAVYAIPTGPAGLP